MKTKTINVYSFDELSDEAKKKVLTKLYDINVSFDWWEFTYEDANNIGLKLEGFDIDRGNYCEGKFLASAEETAHKIEKEHGETCETFKDAKAYLKERDQVIDTAPKDENGDFVSEYELDEKLDELDSEFLKILCQDYLIMLRHEYEYQTSEEAIIETIRANEYEFDENGKLI